MTIQSKLGMSTALTAIAIVLSHLEAAYTRLDHLTTRVVSPMDHRHAVRGEVCPLCGHQLGATEQRPPRITRTLKGAIKNIPAEVLTWRRCGGCALHQVGQR